MKKVLVIGGGFSGLSAASLLSSHNYKVTLLEASPKVGGRAYSRYDKDFDMEIDNGQHVMMTCYDYTLRFLKLINATQNVTIENKLNIPFVTGDGKIHSLKSEFGVYPFNLLSSILNFTAIPIDERIGLLKFFAALKFTNTKALSELSVAEILKEHRQGSAAIKSIWEMLVVGIMNTEAEKASAESFANVMKEVFLNRTKGFFMIIPENGLSNVYCKNAVEFIQNNGGEVKLGERVLAFNEIEGRYEEVITNKSVYSGYDYIISAVPYHALTKIEDAPLLGDDIPFEYSSITSAHFKLKNNKFTQRYYTLIDSPLQWVFNNNTHISMVISSSNHLLDKQKDEIKNLIIKELTRYFPWFSASDITEAKIIREKRATFIPSIKTEKIRPKLNYNFNNLIISGDWSNSGLPSTIESAVKSGITAAESVLQI